MAVDTSPAPRTRLDQWQNRARPDAGTTVGYTRFVRIMKVMLPLIACSLIVLVVVYSSKGREAKVKIVAQDIGSVDKDRQLVSPKLTGTDGRGQPFTVTAKGATQAPGKARRLTIDEVTADITMQDKSWVQVGAVKGELDVEGKTLDLTNSINIYSDQGYECHTEAARYDFGTGLLKGDAPIKCQGPMGLFTAKKFEGLRACCASWAACKRLMCRPRARAKPPTRRKPTPKESPRRCPTRRLTFRPLGPRPEPHLLR
jgi:lipopolysaccharide export system protein LptC